MSDKRMQKLEVERFVRKPRHLSHLHTASNVFPFPQLLLKMLQGQPSLTPLDVGKTVREWRINLPSYKTRIRPHSANHFQRLWLGLRPQLEW
jgi:hypothetical protein